jgi:DNA-3-methyladenine glycosylase
VTARLPRAFYARPTLQVARDLVGMVLVHRTRAGLTAGRIVEVEAYIGEDDPACHAAPGPTTRNRPLYGPPGIVYVYLNYGLHYLTNVVTEVAGFPAAVLLRALEPLDGLDLMRRRRQRGGAPPQALAVDRLCSGPGKLSQAMNITLRQNRRDLESMTLWVEDRGLAAPEVAWSPRIGIRVGTEHHWRAMDPRSPAVSGPWPRLTRGKGDR